MDSSFVTYLSRSFKDHVPAAEKQEFSSAGGVGKIATEVEERDPIYSDHLLPKLEYKDLRSVSKYD